MVTHKFCETKDLALNWVFDPLEKRGENSKRKKCAGRERGGGREKEKNKEVRVNLCMDRWIFFLKHFLFHQGISIAF